MITYDLIIKALETHDFSRISLADVKTALSNKWIDSETAEMIAGIILDC